MMVDVPLPLPLWLPLPLCAYTRRTSVLFSDGEKYHTNPKKLLIYIHNFISNMCVCTSSFFGVWCSLHLQQHILECVLINVTSMLLLLLLPVFEFFVITIVRGNLVLKSA